jgi:CSLREA domain-containing protein
VRRLSTYKGQYKVVRRLLIVLILSLSVFAVSNSYAATLTVTKTADTNDGVCDSDCSLREAIAVAASGDLIAFSELFSSKQTIALELGQIELSKSLTITGPGQDLLSISGNNASRIFITEVEATINLSHLTLRDGRLTNDPLGYYAGAAIYMANGVLNITDVRVTNNYVRSPGPGDIYGSGAISCFRCTMSIVDSLVDHNEGAVIGGIRSAEAHVNISRTIFDSNIKAAFWAKRFDVVAINSSIFRNTDTTALIFEFSCIAHLTSTTFEQNVTGVAVLEESFAEFENCIIRNNGVTSPNTTGGGLFNRAGTAIVKTTLIEGNQVSDSGGGIVNIGDLYLIDSAVVNNAGKRGGGIYNSIGTLYVINSTISGNRVTGSTSLGGGILNYVNGASPGATTILTNSTIAGNSATGKGGGIRNESMGVVRSVNSIIATNTSLSLESDFSGTAASMGNNLVGTTLGNSGWIATDLLNRDPMIGPLMDNGGSTKTHALLLGSPAIDAGNNDLATDPLTGNPLQTDQRGSERYFGGSVDVGAYESETPIVLVHIGGRVTSANGRGLFNTRIALNDGSGNLLYAQTNSSGFYRFQNIIAGRTYTITASNKYFTFSGALYVTINGARDDLDFEANP